MTYTKVHCIGIGGIGLSALAQLYRQKGISVSGSDRDPHPRVHTLLAKAGVTLAIGHDARNVPDDADLVVYSDAIGEGSEGYVEREKARAMGIRECSYFEALGDISKNHFTIAVAGTHGKTTTTGMLAKILVDAKLPPTTIVGSILKDFESNYLSGDPDFFLVEACEYKDHILKLSPTILVITNLELDHTDWFSDLAAVQATFKKAIDALPPGGIVVTNLRDPNIAPLLTNTTAQIVDYALEEVGAVPQIGFNLENAKAAAATARVFAKKAEQALSDQSVTASLSGFQGSWRRFEYKGVTTNGVQVFDDYAHHPTAIQKTIAMAREKFPKKMITVLFHPHLYSRTQSLFTGFAEALSTAEEAYILPIYPARERAEDFPGVSSEALAKAITDIAGNGHYVASFEDAEKKANELIEDAILITMGAGDVYKVAERVAR